MDFLKIKKGKKNKRFLFEKLRKTSPVPTVENRGEHGAVWCGFRVKPKPKPQSAVFTNEKPFGAVFNGAVFAVFFAVSVSNGAVSVFNHNVAKNTKFIKHRPQKTQFFHQV